MSEVPHGMSLAAMLDVSIPSMLWNGPWLKFLMECQTCPDDAYTGSKLFSICDIISHDRRSNKLCEISVTCKMNLNSQCISEIFIAKDWWLHNSNLLAVIVQRTFYRSIAYLDVFESWHCQLLHHQDSLKDHKWFLKCLCRKIGDHGEVPTTHRTMKFSMIHLQTATTHLVQFCLDAPSRLRVVRQRRILFKGPCSPDHSRPRFMPFWSSWRD